jgi:hypothetical protein
MSTATTGGAAAASLPQWQHHALCRGQVAHRAGDASRRMEVDAK